VFAIRPGQKKQQLEKLPHAALLQLLRDDRTRVASENTAAHAVLLWHRAQPTDVGMKRLRQLVRR
jgi:hypothetical protein